MTFIEMRAKNSIETKDRDFDFTVNPIHRDSSAPSNSWRHAIKLSEESESFRPDLFFDDKPSKPKDTFKSKSVKYLKRVDASMMTVGAIVFVGDTSRGVLFPLLSTLCTQLGGSVIDLGYLVAMFSIGRLIVTAPFGYLSDRYRHKLPLLISSFILVLGSIIWANAFTTNRISVLYVAQFLLGVGSGSLGVTRSFVVEQCEPKKRTETLALITALQYAGFTVSPIVGSWLHSLGGGTSLYMSFALPSYLIALLALWCLIALLSVFENIPTAPVVYTHSTKSIGSFKADDSCVEEEEDKVTVKVPISSDQVVSEKEVKDVENRVESAPSIGISSKKISDSDAQLAQNGMFYVIIGMFLLNISTKGSIAVYETLGAQIGLIDYKMSSVALGALISASGAVGFCQLMLFSRVWTKNFSGEKEIPSLYGHLSENLSRRHIVLLFLSTLYQA